jgi:DNA-binding MarR family transcriptional regulator
MNIDIDAAAAAGLTSISQVRALLLLKDAPETMTVISARTGKTTAAITQLIDKLERLGLATRIRGTADRRAVWVKLTPKGDNLATRLTAETLPA